MTRAAPLLMSAYWLVAFVSYEGTLRLTEQTDARYVYSVLTTVAALALFGAMIPTRSRHLLTLFGAAVLAAAGALITGLLPLHDVDTSPNLERLNFYLPWLIVLFAPVAVGAGLRRMLVGGSP